MLMKVGEIWGTIPGSRSVRTSKRPRPQSGVSLDLVISPTLLNSLWSDISIFIAILYIHGQRKDCVGFYMYLENRHRPNIIYHTLYLLCWIHIFRVISGLICHIYVYFNTVQTLCNVSYMLCWINIVRVISRLLCHLYVYIKPLRWARWDILCCNIQ